MADAAAGAPRSLPAEIVIWEILARLPPKPLLRCRAVCREWRRATSTRDFLLNHHARQPNLPLICSYHQSGIDIVPFDRYRARPVATTDDPLQPAALLDDASFNVVASCDGLLILADSNDRFSICNPATRQYSPLRQLRGFRIRAMYRHSPTGEYRLVADLSFGSSSDDDDDQEEDGSDFFYTHTEDGFCTKHGFYTGDGFYVFTLGSTDDAPRCVGCPDAWEQTHAAPLMFHGSVHWHIGHTITVFDTAAESFRQMRPPPAVPGLPDMFEIGGVLGVSIFDFRAITMDIWAMEDYQAEVWTFKHRIEVPVAELTAQFGLFEEECRVVVPSWDGGDAYGLLKFGEWLLQVDLHGKVVASFERESLHPTPFWLKQTLVPHIFFARLEGYVANGAPFI